MGASSRNEKHIDIASGGHRGLQRRKTGVCNLCGATGSLSADHVPPQGLGNIGRKTALRYLDSLSAPTQRLPRYTFQDGVRFYSLCAECNNLLGVQFDPHVARLGRLLRPFVELNLSFDAAYSMQVRLNSIFKSVLGHLVAAQRDIEPSAFDEIAKRVVSGEVHPRDSGLEFFIWIYRGTDICIVRDTVIITSQPTKHFPFCQLLKCSPLGFLVSDSDGVSGMSSLNHLFTDQDTDEVRLSLRLDAFDSSPTWPLAVSRDQAVFMGESGAVSITARQNLE